MVSRAGIRTCKNDYNARIVITPLHGSFSRECRAYETSTKHRCLVGRQLEGGRHECSLRNRFCSQVFRTFQEHSHTIHLGTSHKQRVREKITNLQNINKLKGLINHTLKKKQQNGRGTKLYQFIKCRS